jgi:hypothetical protein
MGTPWQQTMGLEAAATIRYVVAELLEAQEF